MSMFRIIVAVLTACIAVSVSSSLFAADSKAVISYSDLLDYQRRVDGLKDLTRLKVRTRISSTLAGVKPTDIKLTAMLASGQAVAIPLDADGELTLPVTSELEKENPDVVSNQPKKSLQLNFDLNMQKVTYTNLRYDDLMLGAQQFREAIRRQGMMARLFMPTIRGILVVYHQGSHTLVLHTPGGDQVLKGQTIAEAKDTLKHIDMSH
ncbi:MAG TPA: DUF2987 domain-containing protein, partial [Nitrospira sp.]|nr:DUF2987 domain-containing protein [Nitrospira sp.]